MLFQQWTHQNRIMTFDGFCLPEFEHVHCSLPQGDPFSLIAMVAVMMPAIYQIDREFPSVTQRSFVDDYELVLLLQPMWPCKSKHSGPAGLSFEPSRKCR